MGAQGRKVNETKGVSSIIIVIGRRCKGGSGTPGLQPSHHPLFPILSLPSLVPLGLQVQSSSPSSENPVSFLLGS